MRVRVTVSMGQERKLGLRGVRKRPRSQAEGDCWLWASIILTLWKSFIHACGRFECSVKTERYQRDPFEPHPPPHTHIQSARTPLLGEGFLLGVQICLLLMPRGCSQLHLMLLT